MEEDAPARNLVLSVCELKQNGSVPVGRVCPQLANVNSKIFLFGGADEEKSFDDLYSMEIEKVNWSALVASGFSKPTRRYGHTICSWKDQLILFGGLAESSDNNLISVQQKVTAPPFLSSSKQWSHCGNTMNDLLLLEVSKCSWNVPDITGNIPSARAFHAAAVVKNFLIVHGGSKSATPVKGMNDLHVLDLSTMTWMVAYQKGDVPSPRVGHKIVYYPTTDVIYLFGGAGEDGSLYSLDVSGLGTSSFNEFVWNRVHATGTAPVGRSFHSLDIVGQRVFVFAGLTSSDQSDLYIFEIDKHRWSRPLFDGQISYRAHGSTVLHDKLIVFGGARDRPDGNKGKGDILGSDSSLTNRISRRLMFLNVLEIKEGAGDSEFKFKLVTVGDSGVGKSCLLARFVQDVYSDFHVATMGVDFKSVATMIKGKICTLQLWDTAGQERFGGVTGNYYRKADGFVIVYDVTRRQSFEHVDTWLSEVGNVVVESSGFLLHQGGDMQRYKDKERQFGNKEEEYNQKRNGCSFSSTLCSVDGIKEHHECGPDTILLLIGNKYDVKEEVQVTDEEAKACANRIGAIYIATSAKVASNVDAAFLSAAAKLVDLRRRLGTQRKSTTEKEGSESSTQPKPTVVQLSSSTVKAKSGCGCASGGKKTEYYPSCSV
ncbi:Ras family protein [Cardiosporidium cionae]|uniref:Ras family protein n=1 Tax=Cardiosporidium cionae TaxID=476202 RepID=A0ABQ7JDE2_9APIC|nr:Ras family protein [Cardiosporidium cionae]|eukprot:KAF8822001.1 Ras family protein [Cardiosporidium cionae]